MPGPNRCPKCGGERPAGAIEGLCPRCLLGGALDHGPPSAATLDPIGRLRPSKAPWDPRESAEETRVEVGAHPSVLGTLADSLGSVPRVLLRETEAGGLTPVVHPSSREMPAGDPGRERYQLLGEIARGGMGAILKGRDTDLGRDLAVKVLLERHRDHPELIRRFIEEAQIGGQLQHPGVVPVYELGCFEDRRPFFTMKLVRGHTLAALLDARRDPADDRPRFLAVFEAVCQTMAYAHARGVIHRDLKPQNIMVGSFGEVQVMDWGLAKVLRTASVIDERTPEPERETIVETARSASETYASRAGSVLGTPAYMSPEQASGEVEAVDERADVFAMGAILCEILTGRPPYSGRTPAEVQGKATAGDLSEAHDRLSACGAEAELLELARRCLAPLAPDRPREAGEVARAMTAYLSGVQERLRAAELARAQAQARTDEERKRRKSQLRMAAAILLALAAGTAGVATQWNRAETNSRKSEARFDLAREAIERFYTGASEDVLIKEPQLKPLREKLLGSALEFYKKLQASLEAESGNAPQARLAEAYQRVGEITADIGSHPAAIEALEHARSIRRVLARREPDSAAAQVALAAVLEKLSGALSQVGRMTEALDAEQQARSLVQALVDRRTGSLDYRMKLARIDGRLGNLLLRQVNRLQEAHQAIDRAIAAYSGLTADRPTGVAALRGLGEVHLVRAAIHQQLGQTTEAFDAIDQAVAIYEEIAREHPEDLESRERLGKALNNRGSSATHLDRLDDAARSFRGALMTFDRLVHDQPNVSRYQLGLGHAHHSIAWWNSHAGRLPAAVEEYRRALDVFARLDHDYPGVSEYASMHGLTLSNLGDTLRALGRLDEALRTLSDAREVMDRVVRDNPGNPQDQSERAGLDIFIASLLNQMGRREEAVRAYERALASHEALVHKNATDLYNLACAHACLASLISTDPSGRSPERQAEAARHLDSAMDVLRETVSAGYRQPDLFTSDPDLAPLLSRPDFQRMFMDPKFPADPLAPSP